MGIHIVTPEAAKEYLDRHAIDHQYTEKNPESVSFDTGEVTQFSQQAEEAGFDRFVVAKGVTLEGNNTNVLYARNSTGSTIDEGGIGALEQATPCPPDC